MIKQKFDKFWKLAFILSVVSIIVQGLLKLIFKVDWFDLEVNRNIENFFLFRNEISQTVILQCMAMYNFIIFIAISTKSKVKNILSSLIIVILLSCTYFMNLLPQQTIYYMTSIVGLGLTVIFDVFINKSSLKHILWSSFKFCILSASMLVYQYVTIGIRLNVFPKPEMVFSFYEKLVYTFDMYWLCFLYYKIKVVR
jgi:hypothetical protein